MHLVASSNRNLRRQIDLSLSSVITLTFSQYRDRASQNGKKTTRRILLLPIAKFRQKPSGTQAYGTDGKSKLQKKYQQTKIGSCHQEDGSNKRWNCRNKEGAQAHEKAMEKMANTANQSSLEETFLFLCSSLKQKANIQRARKLHVKMQIVSWRLEELGTSPKRTKYGHQFCS